MNFEEEYKRHSFSELVRYGMIVACLVRGVLDRRQAAAQRSVRPLGTTDVALPL